MKYYAVADDPRELLHYGVKGMKWGEHLFGDDLLPKSVSYKNAVKKLKANMASTQGSTKVPKTNGRIAKKNPVQKAITKTEKQQNKFNKAVAKTQSRMSTIEKMYNNVDKPKADSKNFAMAQKKLQSLNKQPKPIKKSAPEQKLDSITKGNRNTPKNNTPSYSKLSKEANNRNKILEKWSQVDADKAYERNLDKAYKAELNAEKLQERLDRKYDKNEKHMQKYTQLAREGRLQYGKLSDDQIQRIGERLSVERNVRALGNTENPKFRVRLKQAKQEGILRGVAAGTASAITQVANAHVQNRLANKLTLDRNARQEAHRKHEANRIMSKRSKREIRQDLKNQAYEESVKQGKNIINRNVHTIFARGAANQLRNLENQEHERLRARNVEDRLSDERQERLAGYLEDQGFNNEREAFRARSNEMRAAGERDFNNRIGEVNNRISEIRDRMGQITDHDSDEYRAARRELQQAQRDERRLRSHYEDIVDAEANRFDRMTDNERRQILAREGRQREEEATRQAYEHRNRIEDNEEGESGTESDFNRRLGVWRGEQQRLSNERQQIQNDINDLNERGLTLGIYGLPENDPTRIDYMTTQNRLMTAYNNALARQQQHEHERPEREHLSYAEERLLSGLNRNRNNNNNNGNNNRNKRRRNNNNN